jgi:hypothetical protein
MLETQTNAIPGHAQSLDPRDNSDMHLGPAYDLQVVLLLTICQSLGPCDSNEVAPSGKQHMGIETELTELYEGGKGTNILGQV